MFIPTKLVCPGDDSLVWREAPANRGWNRTEILELLADGIAGGFIELIDGSLLSDAERNDLYASALLALNRPRHEIKDVFGAPPGHTTYLGTLIPALISYDHASGLVDDVVPHKLGRDASRPEWDLGYMTIYDDLTDQRHSLGLSDPDVYEPFDDHEN